MKYLYALLLLLLIVFIFPYCSDIKIENLISKEISVTIYGEVYNPGQYSLPSYSSLNDLFKIVQTTSDADMSTINPNLILKNGDYIIINKKSKSEKISINFSSIDQLTTLPSIGVNKAQAIIDYRNKNGLFQSLEDIKNVKGIGDKLFEKIKDLICL